MEDAPLARTGGIICSTEPSPGQRLQESARVEVCDFVRFATCGQQKFDSHVVQPPSHVVQSDVGRWLCDVER